MSIKRFQWKKNLSRASAEDKYFFKAESKKGFAATSCRWLTEVRNDGHKIDGVHYVFDEFQFGGTGDKSSDQFEREPENADAFHQKKRFGYVGHFVLYHDRPIFDPVDFVVFKPGKNKNRLAKGRPD